MTLQRDLTHSLDAISHLILDIDGTLTGGHIFYDSESNELKAFSVRDGAGLHIARKAGINVVILTGRKSATVTRRANDLKAVAVGQGIRDKYTWLKDYMQENNLRAENLAYVGDDVNDVKAMQLACLVACPKDAVAEVLAMAHYVSPSKGGQGAVRDVVQFILCLRGQWAKAIEESFTF